MQSGNIKSIYLQMEKTFSLDIKIYQVNFHGLIFYSGIKRVFLNFIIDLNEVMVYF